MSKNTFFMTFFMAVFLIFSPLSFNAESVIDANIVHAYSSKSKSTTTSKPTTTPNKTKPSFSLGGDKTRDTRCVYNCGSDVKKSPPPANTAGTANSTRGTLDTSTIYRKTDTVETKTAAKKSYDEKYKKTIPTPPIIASDKKKSPTTLSSTPLTTEQRVKIANDAKSKLKTPQSASVSTYRSYDTKKVTDLRRERNYWRDKYQWERNRTLSSRDDWGWGYGFYPGLTYQRGWGSLGYGYTRNGISIADGFIIASLLGINSFAGQPVSSNYNVDGSFPDLVAAPYGSSIIVDANHIVMTVPTGVGTSSSLIMPDETRIIDVENGSIVQTPYGAQILVLNSSDMFKPDSNYIKPVYATQAQIYDDYKETNSEIVAYIVVGVIAVGIAGYVAYKYIQ